MKTRKIMKKSKRFTTAMVAMAVVANMAVPAMGGTPKLEVQNSSNVTTFVVNDDGSVGVGVSAADYPFQMSSDIAGSVPAGVGAFMFQGSSNKERFEVQSFGNPYAQGPVFQGKGGGWDTVNMVPTKTLFDHNLFMLGGSGHDGTGVVIGNAALIKIKAESDWSSTSRGTVISFETTPTGSTTRTEYARVNGNGFQISNGGLTLKPGISQSVCDTTRRGMLWFTQGATNVKDTLQVCAKDASNAYQWRTLY